MEVACLKRAHKGIEQDRKEEQHSTAVEAIRRLIKVVENTSDDYSHDYVPDDGRQRRPPVVAEPLSSPTDAQPQLVRR